MNRSHAEKFINRQFNLLRKNIPKSFTLKNYDAIHDYRVAVKRIVAILKFIRQHDLKKNISSLYKVTKLDQIYAVGGELREIQINRKILLDYRARFQQPFLEFRKFLEKKERTARRKVKKSRKKFSFKKCSKFEKQLQRPMMGITEVEMLRLVDHFISSRISEVESLIMDHHVEDKLHRIRKLIKSIKYMLEMSGLERRSYGTLNFTLEKITLLEDHIGKWHDLFVFQEEVILYREKLLKRGRTDHEAGILEELVGHDYKRQFQETVEHIYRDFEIPKRV